MLELRKYPKAELSALFGTRDTQGLKRKLERYGIVYEEAGRGNSGVGKSSILNALDPAFQLKTGEISTALGRGRHTTRHVELFRLSCGAEIMDSPGFSSFETEELNLELKHRLPETFREFAPYLGACQFLNCSHTKEKGCAVREALEAGKLQPSRYQSYLRLFEELKPLREWQEKRK